jgi:hypothetical protein
MNGAGTAVVGDEVETCRGGVDDVRKTSTAAAMMGAAVRSYAGVADAQRHAARLC